VTESVESVDGVGVDPTNPTRIKFSTLQELLGYIQHEVKLRHLYLRELFLDYDTLRKGFVLEDRFRSVLRMVGFVFTDDEFAVLASGYRPRDEVTSVAYPQFCGDVESVRFQSSTNSHGSSEHVEQQLSQLRATQLSQQSHVTIFHPLTTEHLPQSESDRAATDAVMLRLSHLVRTRGVDYKPFFQSHDKINSGTVALHKFFSVLHTAKTDISEEELSLLNGRYGKLGDSTRIRYLPFCTDVEHN